MRAPLLFPLAGIAGGIVLSCCVSFEPRELWLAALAFALVSAVAAYFRARNAGRASVFLLFTVAGVAVELLHRPGPAPELDAGPYELVILEGCVIEPPSLSEDRQQVLLELAPGARARVTFQLKDGETPPSLRYGQRVEVEARVRRPRNFRNPGSFDYAAYLARRHTYWTASARSGATVKVVGEECGTAIWSGIYALRVAGLERLEQLFKNQPFETAISQALLIGDATRLEDAWKASWRQTGTYHALVISGLHVTVLAGFFLLLLRAVRMSELAALGLTALAAMLYALVTGANVPALRATAGFSLFVLARYFYRRRQLLNILAAVAVCFLLIDPRQLFEASFQLSFLAVAAIAALAAPLLEHRCSPLLHGLSQLADSDKDLHLPPEVSAFRVELRLIAETVSLYFRVRKLWALRATVLPAWVALHVVELFAVSACVQLGLALPMVVYFHRLSLSGLLANLIVVPVTTWLVPLGFVAIAGGGPAAALTGVLLRFVQMTVEWHASWEPNWRIPTPPVWLAAALALALVALPWVVRKGRAWRWSGLSGVALLLVALIVHPFPSQQESGVLELTAIDVGQGDGLLVSFPDRTLMLVDAGGLPSYGRQMRARLDIGEDVVSPYLWSRSIKRLDIVAMSHAQADHMGGLASIVRNFRPRELWVGGDPDPAAWPELDQAARMGGLRVVRLWRGDKRELGAARVEVLSPDGAAFNRDSNAQSLVMRITLGERSFLLTGDIERRTERELVEHGQLARVDVLKIAHHGSRTSTTEPFLDAARPAFAVISAGYQTSFRHPHEEVLRRLRERRVAVFRTDLDGLVTVRTDGRRVDVLPAWGQQQSWFPVSF